MKRCPDCRNWMEEAVNHCDNRKLYYCKKCKEYWTKDFIDKFEGRNEKQRI